MLHTKQAAHSHTHTHTHRYLKARAHTQTHIHTNRSPRWRKCIYTVQSLLQQQTSRIYVDKYFSPSTRNIADDLLADIKSRFAHVLDTVAWMNDETRQLAVSKLSMMGMSVGGPSELEKRAPLQLTGEDFLADSLQIEIARASRERVRLLQVLLTVYVASVSVRVRGAGVFFVSS